MDENTGAHHVRYDPRFLRVLRDGACGAAFLHIVFGLFFYSQDVTVLAGFSAVSMLFYAAVPWLLRHRQVMTVIVLAWSQITGYVGVAGVVLGAAAGIHYYLLVVIPLIFVCSPGWLSFNLTLAVVLGAEFLFIDQLPVQVGVRGELDAALLNVFRFCNSLFAFLLAGYLAWIYSQFMRRAERGLTEAANTDPLSGLSNRRHALEVIRREIDSGQARHSPLSFVLVDIDNFKAINDHLGHEAGDNVIAEVSERFKCAVRGQDLVVRWGGEEFLIVLPSTAADGAYQFADRVRGLMASRPLNLSRGDICVTATFGISQYRDGDTVESCVRRADAALYHGKRAGKNRVEIWRPEHDDEAAELVPLASCSVTD